MPMTLRSGWLAEIAEPCDASIPRSALSAYASRRSMSSPLVDVLTISYNGYWSRGLERKDGSGSNESPTACIPHTACYVTPCKSCNTVKDSSKGATAPPPGRSLPPSPKGN